MYPPITGPLNSPIATKTLLREVAISLEVNSSILVSIFRMHLLKARSKGIKIGGCPAPNNPNPIIKKNILLNICIIGAQKKLPKDIINKPILGVPYRPNLLEIKSKN